MASCDLGASPPVHYPAAPFFLSWVSLSGGERFEVESRRGGGGCASGVERLSGGEQRLDSADRVLGSVVVGRLNRRQSRCGVLRHPGQAERVS
jgi:hypothetical protein